MGLIKQTNTNKFYEYAIEISTISNDDTELENYSQGLVALGVKIPPQLHIKIGNVF